MKSKLLLFTAAGFSIDFLDSKIKSKPQLTTSFLTKLITDTNFFEEEVFEKLLENYDHNLVSKEGLFEDCILLIDKYANLLKIVKSEIIEVDINFEHLIFLSELVSDTNKNGLKGETIIDYKFKSLVLENKVIDKISFDLEETLKIKALILSIFYSCFQINENKDKLKQFYYYLKRNFDVNYYTINYDLVLEESIDNIETENFNHLHGQINLVKGEVVISKNEAFISRTGQDIASILNYKVSEIGIGSYNSWDFRHDSDMITGLDKSTKMLNDHYSEAFHKFIIDAYSSDVLVIIGYSFCDYHINSVFRNCIHKYKKVIIVDRVKDSIEFDKKIDNFFSKILGNYWSNEIPKWIEINDFERTELEMGILDFKLIDESISYPDIVFHLNGTLDFIEKNDSTTI